MGNNKLVSVVIPCYNHEKYIKKTVLSVLNQTYSNLEVLVADDCSTDNSADVLKTICDERLKTFFFNENCGTVRTLNFLLEQASGDYIATLGSDDWFMPDKVEKQVRIMEENPDLGAVFTWATFIDGEDKPCKEDDAFNISVFQEKNRSRGEWIRYFFFDGNHMCHSSAVVRREVQDNIGVYNPAYRQLHDLDYWLRLLCRYPVYVIPENLTQYRRADEHSSVSASKSIGNIRRTFNEYSSIYASVFQEVSNDLFREAFSEKSDTVQKKQGELIIEKYSVLRQLSFCGCNIRNAAQDFFIKCSTEGQLEQLNEADFAQLLAMYYDDTAEPAIEYPAFTIYEKFYRKICKIFCRKT